MVKTVSGQKLHGRTDLVKQPPAETVSGQGPRKHYLVKIRSNIKYYLVKYGQTLSGQNTVKHYLVKIRSNIIWSNAAKHYLVKYG